VCCSFLLSSPQRNELDLLAAPLDFKLIAGFEAQLGGVGLADEQGMGDSLWIVTRPLSQPSDPVCPAQRQPWLTSTQGDRQRWNGGGANALSIRAPPPRRPSISCAIELDDHRPGRPQFHPGALGGILLIVGGGLASAGSTSHHVFHPYPGGHGIFGPGQANQEGCKSLEEGQEACGSQLASWPAWG